MRDLNKAFKGINEALDTEFVFEDASKPLKEGKTRSNVKPLKKSSKKPKSPPSGPKKPVVKPIEDLEEFEAEIPDNPQIEDDSDEDNKKEIDDDNELEDEDEFDSDEDDDDNDEDKSLITVEDQFNEINVKKDEIQNKMSSIKINDVEFLTSEIKTLIESSKGVLTTLERDITIGASPRMYEVYSGLLNAITSQYKELRQLNEAVAKVVIENKKQNLEEFKVDQKMRLTGNELLDMIHDANENNSLKAIDAEFEIQENEKEPE